MYMQHNTAAHLDLYSRKIAHPRRALQIAKIQTCQKLCYMYTAYLVRHFSGLKICRYIHKHVCVCVCVCMYIHERKLLHMRKMTVSRMCERYAQMVLTFHINYVHTHIHTYMYVCMYVCMYVHVQRM